MKYHVWVDSVNGKTSFVIDELSRTEMNAVGKYVGKYNREVYAVGGLNTMKIEKSRSIPVDVNLVFDTLEEAMRFTFKGVFSNAT
jgi:hypothetical protein